MIVRFDGASAGSGFSTTPLARASLPVVLDDVEHAVAARLLARHLDDRDDIAAGLVIGVDHLLEAGRVADHQIVDQHHRERLVADQMARAPHRMAETERALLPRIGDLARPPAATIAARRAARSLPRSRKRRFQLVGDVEMVFERALAAAGDEIELLDAGGLRLLDRVMDQRPVDHRQHLLRHRLGRRQDARAEPGHRKHRLAYAVVHDSPLYRDVGGQRWRITLV